MRCINPRFIYLLTSWCFLGFDSWGCRLNQGAWERKAPVGSRGGAQVGVAPQKLKYNVTFINFNSNTFLSCIIMRSECNIMLML